MARTPTPKQILDQLAALPPDALSPDARALLEQSRPPPSKRGARRKDDAKRWEITKLWSRFCKQYPGLKKQAAKDFIDEQATLLSSLGFKIGAKIDGKGGGYRSLLNLVNQGRSREIERRYARKFPSVTGITGTPKQITKKMPHEELRAKHKATHLENLRAWKLHQYGGMDFTSKKPKP